MQIYDAEIKSSIKKEEHGRSIGTLFLNLNIQSELWCYILAHSQSELKAIVLYLETSLS